jgi:hypothetical protein
MKLEDFSDNELQAELNQRDLVDFCAEAIREFMINIPE